MKKWRVSETTLDKTRKPEKCVINRYRNFATHVSWEYQSFVVEKSLIVFEKSGFMTLLWCVCHNTCFVKKVAKSLLANLAQNVSLLPNSFPLSSSPSAHAPVCRSVSNRSQFYSDYFWKSFSSSFAPFLLTFRAALNALFHVLTSWCRRFSSSQHLYTNCYSF